MKEMLLAIVLTLREAITKWIPIYKSADFGILGTMSEILSILGAIFLFIKFFCRWDR